MKKVRPQFVLILALCIFGGFSCAEVEEPKETPEKLLTIPEIMNEAHEDGLLNRVKYNKATDEEKQRLLTLYLMLQKQKPPLGGSESWKELTQKAIDAAKAVVEGKEGATSSVKRAVNCRTCHGSHKPD